MFNIGTHSSCKLRMKEEDSELSHDIAENTQVCLSVLLISIYITINYIYIYIYISIYIYIFFFFLANFWCMFAGQVMHISTLVQQDALSCTGLALSNFILTIFFVASFWSLPHGAGWSFRRGTTEGESLSLFIYWLCISAAKCNKNHHILLKIFIIMLRCMDFNLFGNTIICSLLCCTVPYQYLRHFSVHLNYFIVYCLCITFIMK